MRKPRLHLGVGERRVDLLLGRKAFEPVAMPSQRNHECRLVAGRNAGAVALPRMVCTRCGMIGAEVRPDWGPHVIAGPWRRRLAG
jgi:hypothetical protein